MWLRMALQGTWLFKYHLRLYRYYDWHIYTQAITDMPFTREWESGHHKPRLLLLKITVYEDCICCFERIVSVVSN